jgi:hypothetical protein
LGYSDGVEDDKDTLAEDDEMGGMARESRRRGLGAGEGGDDALPHRWPRGDM